MPPHDEGTLIFCTQCGAPQVLLSEELLTQVEAQAKAAEEGAVGPVMREPASMIWAGALRCIGLAGAIAAALMLLTVLLPPVVFLATLWIVISPVVVIGLFQARFPLTPVTTGFGARLGLLTGLAIGVVLGGIDTIVLVIARFGIHAMGDADKQMTVAIDQFRNQVAAQPGSILVPFANALTVPEFRAGFALVGLGMLIFLLLAITTAGGAFAGLVRSRVRA